MPVHLSLYRLIIILSVYSYTLYMDGLIASLLFWTVRYRCAEGCGSSGVEAKGVVCLSLKTGRFHLHTGIVLPVQHSSGSTYVENVTLPPVVLVQTGTRDFHGRRGDFR